MISGLSHILGWFWFFRLTLSGLVDDNGGLGDADEEDSLVGM